MRVGFHVQSELLLEHLFYMRKIKVFLRKNVSYSLTSPNCSVHCKVVSVYFPIVLPDGEYSNETQTVIDRTLRFPLLLL